MSAPSTALPRSVVRARNRVAEGVSPKRPWTFWVLAALFTAYVLALYGPMFCIYVLSLQDVRGGLVFPMKGHSLHWFVDLFTQVRTGDVKGSFSRSSSCCSRISRSWWPMCTSSRSS